MDFSFDGPTKRIQLNVLTVDVRDLWSRWIDWFLTGDNSKYLPAMRNVGGDDIDATAGTSIPIYVYLINGWKVVLKAQNGTTNVGGGIILVDGGGDPFLNPAGGFSTGVRYSQPVQAIGYSTGGGGGSGIIELDEQLGDHQDPGSVGEAIKIIKDNSDRTDAKVNIL